MKLLREVTTLSRLQHQHVVRYYQAWVEGGEQSWDGISKTGSQSQSYTNTFGKSLDDKDHTGSDGDNRFSETDGRSSYLNIRSDSVYRDISTGKKKSNQSAIPTALGGTTFQLPGYGMDFLDEIEKEAENESYHNQDTSNQSETNNTSSKATTPCYDANLPVLKHSADYTFKWNIVHQLYTTEYMVLNLME